MPTTDITKELENIIRQLNDEGKAPTTALVKARLGSSIPIPAIVAAIKSWKATKRIPKVEVQSPINQAQEAKIAALESRVCQLETKLAQLETQLELNK